MNVRYIFLSEIKDIVAKNKYKQGNKAALCIHQRGFILLI